MRDNINFQMQNLFTNPGEVWSKLGITYKFYSITSLVLGILGIFWTLPFYVLSDYPLLTIFSYQFYRLLFPYLVFGSILGPIFAALWIMKFFMEGEKTKSSVYIFFDIFIINLEIHILFNLLACFTLLFSDKLLQGVIGFGWFPIILILEFRNAAINPQGQSTFCFLFRFKNKYFPWALLLIFMLIHSQLFLCYLSAGIIGVLQELYLKRSLIKLPQCFYSAVQKVLPNFIKTRPDYTSFASVKQNIDSSNAPGAFSVFNRENVQQSRNQESSNKNPFKSNSQPKFEGQGVLIDDQSAKKQKQFKGYWAAKDSSQDKQNDDDVYQEIEIEPKIKEIAKPNNDQSKNDLI